MKDTMNATMVGHITIFLTVLAGYVFQWLREGRRHRWQEQRFNGISDQIKKNGNH